MDDLKRATWQEKLFEVQEILEKDGTKRNRSEVIKLSEFLSLVPALTNMCPRSELDAHLIDLSSFVEMVKVKEGEIIFHKGEGSTHFFFVLQGTLAVFIQKSTKEIDLEEKLLAQLAKWQLDLERVESHNAMMVKQQAKQSGKYENELEEAEAFEAIKQGIAAAEVLQSQIRQGKISLKEYSCLQDEQLLRGAYESRYFRGEKSSTLCNFKKVQLLSESDSFGESILSSTSQQRTGTVVACPGTNVILGRIEKNHFLSVFNKELDKRQQIRRALLSSYKNDLNDKVLNTLTFQFREMHLLKNTYIATQGLLFSSEQVAKVEDSPLTKRRSKEQQYLAEKEEHLYFLYKGSLEVQVKSLVNLEDQNMPEIVKKSINSSDADNLLKSTNNSHKPSLQPTQLRLTQLSEGEFFGHENWFKEDIEKLLKNTTTEVVQLPEQQFKDKLAQQLYIDFSIVVAEIDTIVFRIPKKYLLEEQNQFLFKSLVANGKQRHNRYANLEKQAIIKEQNKLRYIHQQQSPSGSLGLADKPRSSKEQEQQQQNSDMPNRRKLFANSKVATSSNDDNVSTGISQQKVHFKNQFESFRKKFDVEFNFSVSQFSHPVNAVGSTAASLFHNSMQREKQQIQFKRSSKMDLIMPFPAGDLKDYPETTQITNNQLDKDKDNTINMNVKEQSQIKDKQQTAQSLSNLDVEENFTDHNFKYPKKNIQRSQDNSLFSLRGKSMHNLDMPIKEKHDIKLKRDSTGSFHQEINSNNIRQISPGKNRIIFMNQQPQQLIRQQQQQQGQDIEGSFQQLLKAQPSIVEETPGDFDNIQHPLELSQPDPLIQDKTAKQLNQKTKLLLLKIKKPIDKSGDEDMSPILIRSISKQSSSSVTDFSRINSPEINRDSSPKKLQPFTQLKSIINLNRVQTADDKDFITWSQQELQSQERKTQQPNVNPSFYKQPSFELAGTHKNGRQQYSSSVHIDASQNRQVSMQQDPNYQQQQQQQLSLLGDESTEFQKYNSQHRIDSAQQKQRNKFEDQRVTQIYYTPQSNPSPQLSPTKTQIISKETLSGSGNSNISSRKRIISKGSSPPGSQQSQKRLHSLIKEPTIITGKYANSSSPVKINKPQIQPSSQPLSPPLKSKRYLFTQGDPNTLFHTFSYQSSQKQQELQQQSSIPDQKYPSQWKQEESSSESFQTVRRSLSPIKLRRTQETFKDISQQQQQYDSVRSSSIHFVDSAAGNENISQARFSVYIDKARLAKNNSQDPRDSKIVFNNQNPRVQQQSIQHIIHSCFKKR